MGYRAAPASVTLNPQVTGKNSVITEAELSNSGGLQSTHTAHPTSFLERKMRQKGEAITRRSFFPGQMRKSSSTEEGALCFWVRLPWGRKASWRPPGGPLPIFHTFLTPLLGGSSCLQLAE